MNCAICQGDAVVVKQEKQARYRGEVVEVARESFWCESCREEFLTPEQLRAYARSIKNEIRKRHGLLPPEKIVEIRVRLRLTQTELEELLGTGAKTVVRWETGKVIQGSGHDNLLRLLDWDPAMLERLRQVQEVRLKEQREYAERGHKGAKVAWAR